MLTKKEKILVLLSMFEVSNKKQETILELMEDVSPEKIFENQKVVELLSNEEYHKLVGFDELTLDRCIENMQKSGITILTVLSEDYPKSLVDLPDRPLILYAKGDLSLLGRKSVAVVGTRSPSNYGKIVTEKFVDKLARAGVVIVSGLCYGVDAIAHKKTLDVKGKTIAVVGSGFNNIYPSTNTNLANEIAENGLLLSEYYPSFVAKRYTFPRRNRIVAGLSDGVLITEAGIKSGTVHTKEFALEYGKDMFAVPGNIGSEKSELPNYLIKTAQAECVLDGDDILSYYGIDKVAKKQVVALNFDEKLIVDLLAEGDKNFDDLAEKSKIPVNILNSCLTTLEIRGLIRKLPAQTFALL